MIPMVFVVNAHRTFTVVKTVIPGKVSVQMRTNVTMVGNVLMIIPKIPSDVYVHLVTLMVSKS